MYVYRVTLKNNNTSVTGQGIATSKIVNINDYSESKFVNTIKKDR